MESDRLKQLRKRIAAAPTKPGIYRWLNEKGDVLYIGKAKNVRKRLRSYVRAADKAEGPWKTSLRRHIADFDVTVTGSELEALILETNLIKEKKPKYNVLMKDDKNYVYVRIALRDAYPGVSLTRRMERDDAKYFGPYLTAYRIKHTLELLHTMYDYKACEKSIMRMNSTAETAEASAAAEACLEHQVGKCNGLCAGKVSKEEYRSRIDRVVAFLSGDYAPVLRSIRELMARAAKEKRFEKAAKLRDALAYVQSLDQEQVVSDTSQANTDAVGVALRGGKVQVVLLQERGGRLIGERSVEIRGEADSTADVLEQFLPQYYSDAADIPDTILIGEHLPDRATIGAWFGQIRGKRVEVKVPERGKKSRLLRMAEANAGEKIAQQFAKWEAESANIETALEQLQKLLKFPRPPKRIEAYDISHLGGSETVGAMAVAVNGKAANAEYRSFTIRTMREGEIDDCKALAEVLRRRLLHLAESQKRQEQIWNERSVTIRPARKADQSSIAENRKNRDLPTDDDAYKETVVATKGNTMIGMARLQQHATGIYEIRSVWVDSSARGNKLGHALVRTLLKKKLKGKVYVAVESALEEYYATIGFRHVREPPAAMRTAMEARYNGPLTYMMYDASHQKPDPSLTCIPDLLLIDGGKGQLNAARKTLGELNLRIPVIAIAKREEDVFIAGDPRPADLPKDSPASFLLQRLRDEAHRFSNRHREKRAGVAAVASSLGALPGFGEATVQKIIRKFGSVENARKASDDDLRAVLTAKQVGALRGM